MKNKKLTIGISLRVVENTDYNEKRDALSQDWSQFFERLGINPLLIPNTIKDISSFLEDMQVEGLFLSGGDNIGDNQDRDETEQKIINYSLEKKIPLIGICRGMQVINTFFGGTLNLDLGVFNQLQSSKITSQCLFLFPVIQFPHFDTSTNINVNEQRGDAAGNFKENPDAQTEKHC